MTWVARLLHRRDEFAEAHRRARALDALHKLHNT
jgi:hypothetical protein